MFETTFHDTILVVVQVAALLIVAYLLRTAYQAKLARKHELSKRILDKMTSQEFLKVLQSPEGERSLERLIGSQKAPGEWVTDAVRRSILLLFAGAALLLVYPRMDFSGREMFLIMGSLFVGVGVGYLVAAALTWRRAKRDNTDPAA